MKCVFCAYQSDRAGGWNFCPECGANISDKCYKCGAQIVDGARFCVNCGAPMRYRHVIPVPCGNISIVIETGEDSMKKDDAAITETLYDSGKENPPSSLDLNSFNQSETPDFLKNINAKHAGKYKLEDEKRNENKNIRSGLLDSRSFNDSEAPDFLSEIIKKGKQPLINFEPENGDNNCEEDIKQASAEPEAQASAGPEIKPEAKPESRSKIETDGGKEFDAADKPCSFDKFKAPPRIESILKEDKEHLPASWGIGVEKKADAPEVSPAFKAGSARTGVPEDIAIPDEVIEGAAGDSGAAACGGAGPGGEKNVPKAALEIKSEVKTAPESGESAAAKLSNRRLIAVDSGNNRIQFVTSDAKFITSFGARGAGQAQFDNPQKAAIDAAGNIYISDFSNNRIQKFTSDGQFLLSFGSHGGKNGEFNYPCGLALSKEGLLFVVDSYNNRVQVFDCDGKYISKFEGAEISSDAQLDTPTDIALDSANNIYVCDTGNNRVIKFDPKWRKLFELGISDKKNQGFDSPSAVAIDSDDNLIVADTGNHLIKIFDSVGRIVSIFGAKGQKEGKLDSPGALSCDEDKNIYIADTWNNRIQIFTFDGAFIRAIGSYGSDPGKFNHINDVVIAGAVI